MVNSDRCSDGHSHGSLDETLLLELEEIMEDEFVTLLETYLADSALKLAALDTALADMSSEKLVDSAHGFKGSSLNIGAVLLSSLCSELEDQARQVAFDLDGAARLITQIKLEFERVKHLLEIKCSEL